MEFEGQDVILNRSTQTRIHSRRREVGRHLPELAPINHTSTGLGEW